MYRSIDAVVAVRQKLRVLERLVDSGRLVEAVELLSSVVKDIEKITDEYHRSRDERLRMLLESVGEDLINIIAKLRQKCSSLLRERGLA